MAFFKTIRDKMKANALLSHLEFARERFPTNTLLGRRHLSDALKALVAIKASDGHDVFSSAGWKQVVHVATELGMMMAALGNFRSRASSHIAPSRSR